MRVESAIVVVVVVVVTHRSSATEKQPNELGKKMVRQEFYQPIASLIRFECNENWVNEGS